LIVDMRPSDSVILRPLTDVDLPEAQRLSTLVEWPHRLNDWKFVASLGSGVAAVCRERLVGVAMSWRFGRHEAAVGMIIVAPIAQGRGIGRRLVARVLAPLAGRAVTLYATEAGIPLYRSFGFATAATVLTHQGYLREAPPPLPAAGEPVRPATVADLDSMVRLDEAATGAPRCELLSALLPCATGVVLERGGVPRGFAILRRFGRGFVVGPVVAPDRAGARALIASLVSRDRFLRIDVPELSELSLWLERLGLAAVGTATMMRLGAPPSAWEPYALFNQALG
jgi:GNAT superfamily N-acetyltransferase